MKKSLLTTLCAFLILLHTSCIGTFSAFNSLKDWNMEVTDDKFVNELIFLGLNIVPVYGLFTLGDVLLFNAIEFWTGDSPIGMSEGDCEERWVEMDGKSIRLTAKRNRYILEEFDAQQRVVDRGVLKYNPNTHTWTIKKGEHMLDVLHVDQRQELYTLMPGTEEARVVRSGRDIEKLQTPRTAHKAR